MRDYPWAVPISQEVKDLDIPIEVSLWGVLGMTFSILNKISVVGLYADPDFGGEDNKSGIYTVDVGFYTAEGFINIISSIINVTAIGFGI